jgi:SulP family sulfate permease
MVRRYLPFDALPKLALRPAIALREVLKQGYSKSDFSADLMAGIVVGVVALPLSMALAIASGVPPQHGLYTAIVAGGVIAVLGGSRVQVSGPTAAFVVVLAPITHEFGIGGLMIATLMAGIILLLMGAFRLGRLVQFIPHPVTTGFTAGIATVIATLQLKDFLGLSPTTNPDHFIERVGSLLVALPTVRWSDLIIGIFTLAVLIAWPRYTKKVPGPLVALSAAGVVAALLHVLVPGFDAFTIAGKFSYLRDGISHPGIPQLPPHLTMPWSMPGADGQPLVASLAMFRTLLPAAFAIAMLGAIESLLSAVVADGMAGSKHDPDGELVAQGIGNILSPFFGGIAATGAIARTATNIRAGAKSPIAALVHALFVLLAVLLLAPALGYLPMASLAALLMLVAYNMSELGHFKHILAVAPKSDVAVLLGCFFLTVVFDMVVSVTFGVLLAAMLFMRRMADLSHTQLVDTRVHTQHKVPSGVALYEVAGPLFFGAAQKAMGALNQVDNSHRVVILDMESVPVLDVTGLVALESTIGRLNKQRKKVVLAGVQKGPLETMHKGHLAPRLDQLAICQNVEEAIAVATSYLERNPLPGTAAPVAT